MTIDLRYYGGTNSIPTQFCQKCGGALGTSVAIEGGLSFHPWCAPSVNRHHGAWSEDCNKANLEIDQLKAKLAEAEAALAKWQWIATHEVIFEVIDDSHGREDPAIVEREEWELSQLIDAEKDR